MYCRRDLRVVCPASGAGHHVDTIENGSVSSTCHAKSRACVTTADPRAPLPRVRPGAHALIGGVLFDFGGTLDADGLTWKARFFRLCQDEGLVSDSERFDPAFYAADDALVGTVPATLPFHETLDQLAGGVTRALGGDDATSRRIA